MSQIYDVIIIGAGAAGLMCAIEAGKRQRRVLLLDHAPKLAEKIRISGGGRCNFTNLHAAPDRYISQNPHFCKSALSRYTQRDFIALVEKHGIKWHEKTLGQLFCDERAQGIIDMLRAECDAAGVVLKLETSIQSVSHMDGAYVLRTNAGEMRCAALVIASGGLSIPKIGATKFGYDIARQFNIPVVPTRPGLVPLTFSGDLLDFCKNLSGVSVDAIVSCGKTSFQEGLLFTHRGLSGPSILQISSYWEEGKPLMINLSPGEDALAFLKERKTSAAKQDIHRVLAEILPKNLAQGLCDLHSFTGRIADLPGATLERLANAVNRWQILPSGTEGYRTAEVTLGGVDTNALSSKTMEARTQPGLYFIGEAVDVTGHLGGFNFQWAWSSGYVAGQAV
ncbi:MAG: NAD(P)/FAD-dependent oxidoreductase [Alphaproteobacteria bacterium]|nr:NAD(P)/FAD-dependent oxidoreductase [Alphaproteobacteria bacterium]